MVPHTELVHILHRCRRERDHNLAVRLYACLKKVKVETSLGNALVVLLAEVGCILDAQQVFDGLLHQDANSWSSLISAYVKYHKPQHALVMYQNMQMDASMYYPSAHAFVSLLKACAKLKHFEMGVQIHADISKMGLLETDPFIGSTLVDMYAKCGSLDKAYQVFRVLPDQDVVSWTALIAGYSENGHAEEALKYFDQMQVASISPDSVIFVCSLKACGSIQARDKGQEIHSHIEKRGILGIEPNVGNTLVDMYVKCGMLLSAKKVFDMLMTQDVVSWTTLISGYTEHGYSDRALECFKQMQEKDIVPNAVTFLCTVRACSSIKAIDEGCEIHGEVECKGLIETDPLIGNVIVDMYAKCSFLCAAHEVFRRLPIRDVVSWTTLITGYVDHGRGDEALEFFEQMQLEGVSPNSATYVCILKACASIRDIDKARKIHEDIKKNSLERDATICTSLVDMYAKCGLVTRAQQLFNELLVQDVVSWNALMTGYIEYGYGEEALKCFEQMQNEGICPDEVTFLSILKACSSIGAAKKGMGVHVQIETRILSERGLVLSTILVDMYAKCSLLNKAREIFDKVALPDVVLWTALISGYVDQGYGEEALECFEQMQVEGRVLPNSATFICIVKACGGIGATNKGQEIHCDIEKRGLLGKDICVGNSLVDMYAKCGALVAAQQVFETLPVRDVVSWNSVIAGYAYVKNGGNDVFFMFHRMIAEGVQPNPVTFVILQHACNRLGLFCTSQTYYESMSKDFGIVPTFEHQSVMIALHCQEGKLHNAVAMIGNIPVHSRSQVWHTVLSACSKSRNIEIGQLAFEHAVGLDDKNVSA